ILVRRHRDRRGAACASAGPRAEPRDRVLQSGADRDPDHSRGSRAGAGPPRGVLDLRSPRARARRSRLRRGGPGGPVERGRRRRSAGARWCLFPARARRLARRFCTARGSRLTPDGVAGGAAMLRRLLSLALLAGVATLVPITASWAAVGTAFTYQGQ